MQDMDMKETLNSFTYSKAVTYADFSFNSSPLYYFFILLLQARDTIGQKKRGTFVSFF